jgi:hypothetical protein
MKLAAIIDRFEAGIAVLEIGNQEIDWPVSLLPAGAQEGQAVHIQLSVEDMDDSAAAKRLERLDKKGPQGHNFNI